MGKIISETTKKRLHVMAYVSDSRVESLSLLDYWLESGGVQK